MLYETTFRLWSIFHCISNVFIQLDVVSGTVQSSGSYIPVYLLKTADLILRFGTYLFLCYHYSCMRNFNVGKQQILVITGSTLHSFMMLLFTVIYQNKELLSSVQHTNILNMYHKSVLQSFGTNRFSHRSLEPNTLLRKKKGFRVILLLEDEFLFLCHQSFGI